MREDTLEQVKQVAIDLFDVEAAKLVENAKIEDFGLDSIDKIELVMGVEEFFQIELPDDEVENVETLEQLTELIDKKRNLGLEE